MTRRERDYAGDWDDYVDQWRVFADQEPSNRGRRDLLYPGDEWGTPEDWSEYADLYLRPFVPPDGSGIAVEIGSGSGKYTLQLLGSVRRMLCLDVSARFIEVARSRMLEGVEAGRVEFELLRQQNAYEVQRAVAERDLLGRVDLLFSVDSMQHVELHTLFAYLVNAAACLKLGGHLAMTVANCTSEEGYARLVAEAGWCYGGTRPSRQFYFLSKEIVCFLLERLGFEPVRLDDRERDINFVARKRGEGVPELEDVKWAPFSQAPPVRRIYALRANVDFLRTLQAAPANEEPAGSARRGDLEGMAYSFVPQPTPRTRLGVVLASLASRVDRAAHRLGRRWPELADSRPAIPANAPAVRSEPAAYAPGTVARIRGGLEARGIPVMEVQIDPAAYRGYLAAAERDYERSDGDRGHPGAALEDFVVARVLDLGPYDIFIDLLAADSPACDIYARVFRAICYRQDPSFPPGLHGDRIGGPATSWPLPGGFASRIAVRTGSKTFLKNLDRRLLTEVERVLCSGGVACWLLCLAEEEPAVAQGGPVYTPSDLERRLQRHRGRLDFAVHHLTNLERLEPHAPPMFVGMFRKP